MTRTPIFVFRYPSSATLRCRPHPQEERRQNALARQTFNSDVITQSTQIATDLIHSLELQLFWYHDSYCFLLVH